MSPPKWERWCVFLLLAAFLAFNLLTYSAYPEVWCDEVFFSEPAVNAVQYGSFTTMVYQFQPPGTFPAPNCPLYLLSLLPWLSITGTTLLSVRSFNYVLMAVAAALSWFAVVRFDLVKKPVHRLLMLVLLHLGYGMSFAYRCSRPDILGLVCLLLLFLSFGFQRRVTRELCIALFSAITIWIGLQVSLFAGFAGVAAWFGLRRPAIRELIVMSVSMGISTGLMLLFFVWKGVLSTFLLLTVGILGRHYTHHAELSKAGKISRVISQTLVSYVDDFTVTVLTFGLALIIIAAWKRLQPLTRRILFLCAILVFVTPGLFNVVGHYAFYYSYVRFVPATFAFFVIWSDLSHARQPGSTEAKLPSPPLAFPPNWVFVPTLILAMAVGLPMRLTLTALTAHVASRHDLQTIIATHVHREDVAFSDYACFFETKRAAQAVYDRFCSPQLLWIPIHGRDLTDEQKRAVNVLVIRPKEEKFITDYFGGSWVAVVPPFGDTYDAGWLARLPVIGKRLEHYLSQPQTERYQVQIFRRAS